MTSTASISSPNGLAEPAVITSSFRAKLIAKLSAAIQDIAALLALMLALPFNLLLVALALLLGPILKRFQILKERYGEARSLPVTPSKIVPKTVLISGGKMTKALQLARSFNRAGHRVILIETHKYWLSGHRFSRAVDKFYTVPEPSSADYALALLKIVQQEQVDTYVPVCSPVASYFDSQVIALLAPHCEVLHVNLTQIQQLDDKYQFAKAAQALGLAVPKSYRITHPQQVIDFDFSAEQRPYILKSIAYDAVRRLNLTQLPGQTPETTAAFVNSLPISESKPWIMQEFISGVEYCTHSTLKKGELRLHCCCQSSAFQVNYENVEQPDIEAWVKRFAKGMNLTGQVSFDFIQAQDSGEMYAIECNPRTHSAITMFYSQPAVATAYLSDEPLTDSMSESSPKPSSQLSFGSSSGPFLGPVRPLPASRPTYWIYHEVWRLLTHLTSRQATVERLKIIAKGKDAIFDWQDPLPFLMVHHWQILLLLLNDLRQLKGWIRIDFNIGKLVQLGGD